MVDEMRLECQGMPPLHVLRFGSLGWDQRPPYQRCALVKICRNGKGKKRVLSSFFPVPFFSRSFPRTSLLPASNRRSSLNTDQIHTLQDTTDAQRRQLSVAKNRTENNCLMTKISARKVGSRDVRWSKFVGTGKERNAFFPVSFPFPFFPVPFRAHL